MTMTADEARAFQDEFARLVRNVEQVLLGKSHVVRLAFTAMVTGGHLLLEDVPGTGKTSLARAMAQTVDGTHSRVQFTPDVLPGDITGVSVYDQRTGEFEFHRGPVFASIVLADEINRASPKTQSALLEVMEEGRVTVDGTPYDVGHPFMVIATQNPIEQAGTYALPEAQLDRFLLRTSIGYPDHESMLRILQGASVSAHDVTLAPVASAAAVRALQERAGTVHVDPAVITSVLLDLEGTVLRHVSSPTPSASRPDEVVALVARLVDGLIADAGVDRQAVLGVGLAAPGPIDVGAGLPAVSRMRGRRPHRARRGRHASPLSGGDRDTPGRAGRGRRRVDA
nr:AAA family ATPase [Clavibacter michiganensis]